PITFGAGCSRRLSAQPLLACNIEDAKAMAKIAPLPHTIRDRNDIIESFQRSSHSKMMVCVDLKPKLPDRKSTYREYFANLIIYRAVSLAMALGLK
ncbi:hypothetical protein KQ738_15865, partial [Listeria monocytogenes]|nr:hypothetical protein [Listeria monocytogenes]